MGMVYLYGQTQTERETINGIIQGTNSTRLQVSNLSFTPKHITVLLHTDSSLDPGTFIWALYDNGNITSDLWQESFYFSKGTQYYYEVY